MTTLEIKISEEYKKLVPPLTQDERDSLYESIRKNGQYIPIVVNHEGVVLDGHHRYEICKELEYIPKYEIKQFEDKDEEEKFVIECNLDRRHLNEWQKAELGFKLEEIEVRQAKKRFQEHLPKEGEKGFQSIFPSKEGNTKREKKDYHETEATAQTAKKVGMKRSTYERAKKVKNQTTEEVKEKLRKGQTTITREYNNLRRDDRRAKKKQEIKEKAEGLNLPKKVSIYDMDIQQVTNKEVRDNSVDLIFTDPPYKDEYLYLYDELANFASKKLAPGGSLVFFFGRQFLPTVMDYFKKYDDLKYWWLFATKYTSDIEKIFPQKVAIGWKPLLWFVKGKRIKSKDLNGAEVETVLFERSADKIILDFIEREERANQDLHDWAQGNEEAKHIIENLTVSEDSIVCDPFLGSGTFGIVANRLGRYFIGIDIDPNTCETARNNIISKDSDNKKSG